MESSHQINGNSIEQMRVLKAKNISKCETVVGFETVRFVFSKKLNRSDQGSQVDNPLGRFQPKVVFIETFYGNYGKVQEASRRPLLAA